MSNLRASLLAGLMLLISIAGFTKTYVAAQEVAAQKKTGVLKGETLKDSTAAIADDGPFTNGHPRVTPVDAMDKFSTHTMDVAPWSRWVPMPLGKDRTIHLMEGHSPSDRKNPSLVKLYVSPIFAFVTKRAAASAESSSLFNRVFTNDGTITGEIIVRSSLPELHRLAEDYFRFESDGYLKTLQSQNGQTPVDVKSYSFPLKKLLFVAADQLTGKVFSVARLADDPKSYGETFPLRFEFRPDGFKAFCEADKANTLVFEPYVVLDGRFSSEAFSRQFISITARQVYEVALKNKGNNAAYLNDTRYITHQELQDVINTIEGFVGSIEVGDSKESLTQLSRTNLMSEIAARTDFTPVSTILKQDPKFWDRFLAELSRASFVVQSHGQSTEQRESRVQSNAKINHQGSNEGGVGLGFGFAFGKGGAKTFSESDVMALENDFGIKGTLNEEKTLFTPTELEVLDLRNGLQAINFMVQDNPVWGAGTTDHYFKLRTLLTSFNETQLLDAVTRQAQELPEHRLLATKRENAEILNKKLAEIEGRLKDAVKDAKIKREEELRALELTSAKIRERLFLSSRTHGSYLGMTDIVRYLDPHVPHLKEKFLAHVGSQAAHDKLSDDQLKVADSATRELTDCIGNIRRVDRELHELDSDRSIIAEIRSLYDEKKALQDQLKTVVTELDRLVR